MELELADELSITNDAVALELMRRAYVSHHRRFPQSNCAACMEYSDVLAKVFENPSAYQKYCRSFDQLALVVAVLFMLLAAFGFGVLMGSVL